VAEWLRCHPNIFMSAEKEPYFFNTDDGPSLYTLDRYEDLFRGAHEQHIAIGEASAFYLSSSKAVINIIRYQPEARFIVMVRNPVEMAQSYHAEMVRRGAESVRDFSSAWRLQEDRRLGLNLPAFSATNRHFLYGEICSLGAQLERLLSIVPRDRVLVIVLDDMASNPRNEYLRVLNFLGVPDDGRSQFRVHNSARAPRWPNLLRWTYLLLRAKRGLGIKGGLGVATWMMAATQFEQQLPSLPTDVTETLKKHFAGDVERLGKLLGRDLRHWLSCD
jgi:Sulfotransferase family